MDGDHTRRHGNTTDLYSDDYGTTADGDRPMVACTQYLGDDLDIKVIHPSQQKMTKR